jgi:hypothetical protein
MLILAEAARSGFIVKEADSWHMAPGLRELSKFLTVEKACLLGLGLGRRVKPVQSLHQYLDQDRSDPGEVS